MQITQERAGHDLWQTTWSLCNRRLHHCQNVTVVFAANTLCSPPTWQIVREIKQVLKTSISGTNTSSQIFMPFTGVSFINDCLLQPMLHVNHLLLQLADITDPLLSSAALFSIFHSHKLKSELGKQPSCRMSFEVSHAICQWNQQQLQFSSFTR